MLKIGEYQDLKIIREKPQGFYLECDEHEEVLLPQKYITEDMNIGDMINVIVYTDTEDLEVATTEKALLTVNQFAFLHVNDVNQVGAFCDWGVNKELFIPFRNQAFRLTKGQHCMVYMYLDEDSDRLVGTTKLRKHLKHVMDDDIKMGQQVDIIIYKETDLGYKAIIENKYSGLLYKNETEQILLKGQRLKAFTKPARNDGKIDLSLHPVGYANIDPIATMILEKIESNNGFLNLTDKSDPELIKNELGISKKLFKKAIGSLYKNRLIELQDEGIQLVKK